MLRGHIFLPPKHIPRSALSVQSSSCLSSFLRINIHLPPTHSITMSVLDNLQQLLYAPTGTRYLVLSRASPMWELSMWTSEGPGTNLPRVWSGIGDAVCGRTRDGTSIRARLGLRTAPRAACMLPGRRNRAARI
jgi:hypothetical protein